jgi:hypothetical protein
MSTSNVRVAAAALALLCGAGAVQAMPFGIFDPRSIAMGGTGVSSGTGGNASHFNPALLAAAGPKDRFAFEMMAAVRAADPDKLQDDVDRMDSSGNNLSAALDRFNQAATLPEQQAAAGQLANALGAFRSTLQTVNNKTLEGNFFASPLTVGVPGKDLGWAIHAGARADFGAKLFFDQSDDARLTSYQNAALAFSTSGDPTVLAPFDTNGDGRLDDPTYQSRLDVRGVAIGEVGVSLAHEFRSWDKLAVGITPKYVRVYTFDYSVNPQRSEITIDKGRKDYTSGNFDIGFAKDLGSGFKAGVVGKNVIARTYATALGNNIEVKPQVRAGASYHSSWATVAIDVDLTENKPVAFDKPTRYAGIGAELNVWDFLALRAGYRADLTGNYSGVPSVGLGLSIFGVHLDAAVARRGSEDVTAAVQLGFSF